MYTDDWEFIFSASYMSNETPPLPIVIAPSSGSGGSIEIATATFYRTQFNSNIEVTLSTGSASSGVYVSASEVLPTSSFNATSVSPHMTFASGAFTITSNVQVMHTATITFKLQKTDATNYTNYRELRLFPAMLSGTAYNSAVGSNIQPATGDIEYAHINGIISHTAGDVVTLAAQVAQVVANASDTLLTIFRIDWQLTAIIS